MITFLIGSILGLWLGGWLVYKSFQRGIRDGFELRLSDTGGLVWRKITKDGEK